MIQTVLNPTTGRFWYYEISQRKYDKKELKELSKEIKKKLKETK